MKKLKAEQEEKERINELSKNSLSKWKSVLLKKQNSQKFDQIQ